MRGPEASRRRRWLRRPAAAAAEQGRSFTDYLEAVLQAERDFRRARSAATMVRMAGFPAVKTLESYDFKFATSAPKRQIEQLAALAFGARKENVVFLGPSGVGKTQVSIASRVRCHGEVAEAYGFAEDRGSDPVPGAPGTGSRCRREPGRFGSKTLRDPRIVS
ncbi:ATP-binding protein [Cereibacter azotoformans]|uniref:ATP-binding protein n=1 Tax=Cereibacter azotoformans TaxID=43057 RepID=UPI001EEA2D9D|nr:ATP-binding protein [Cereibacter azotoformans]ULB09971.1 ATP-binding protein [Cereibacter azotoformans]